MERDWWVKERHPSLALHVAKQLLEDVCNAEIRASITIARNAVFKGLKKNSIGDEILGEVAITYRILPESTDIDLRELEGKVRDASKDIAKIQGMQQKPIAFGLTALLIRVVIEDKEGGPDEIENALSGISGVQSVEALDMTRLL